MKFNEFRVFIYEHFADRRFSPSEAIQKSGASKASVYRWLKMMSDDSEVINNNGVYHFPVVIGQTEIFEADPFAIADSSQPITETPIVEVVEEVHTPESPINPQAIASFAYKQMGEVRTATVDGEPWFCLNDVCEMLLIANPRQVSSRLDDDEKGYFPLTDSLGRNRQATTFVNESGLYSVIIRSDKPEAKAFRKWITSEVLPSIRKTGKYAQDPLEKLGELLQEFGSNNPIQNGSVYIISAGEKFYKIGFTQCDVDSRMANLQTGCPLPLSVVTHQEKDDPRRVERVLHDALSDFRLSGEWFSLDEKQLAIACEVLEVA